MQTLEFGLASLDSEVAGDSLEALAALAQFHCRSVAAGGPGLAAHAAPGTPLGSSGKRNFDPYAAPDTIRSAGGGLLID